ncbi:acyl-CoA synthetase [Desulfobacula toluolica]|uniref:AcsA5: acetyl-coenzyme A synthetase (Acetate--CoA ligase) n=1 Tax=Desulfobacula toluolica (strain DSM 7467 / Tol2) TaxID=651182 RepID=K0NS09_DESTT|nr:AMP-binding protein [Desulfobacula toluolica]CCK81757.1 AcsA5: acetyl-coenzyme A synthetase (acetate--CoA ligase) [Desulfobacula toluolica Tol2]
MKELFKEVIRINMMEDALATQECAKKLFIQLNAMEIPEYFNWASDIFEDLHVKENPDKKALIWTDLDTRETKTYSYGTLFQKANQLINFFHKSGVEKGDSLYMMTPNLPENWFACLGCIKAGIVSVPTATTMTQRELEFRFEIYPPNVVVADQASADLIDKALEEIKFQPKLKLVLGQKAGWTCFDVIENESFDAKAAKTKSDDILFCFFTSGTTGLPKRVGHTAVSYPVGHLSTAVMIGVRPDDIHHNLSAPGWAKWCWSSFFAPFNVGATTIGFKYSFLDGEQYLDAVSRHKVTTFCAPPTVWRTFVNMNLDSFDLSCLRNSVSAGEPLNSDVIEKWKKYTKTQIRDIYGQTESTAMIGTPPWKKENIRPGSFGNPFFMYDMALADDEGNEITQADQVGHIVVKLNNWRPIGLFSEYIGNPEKMSSVFVDNYYYTGDRASFDEDGYWWFVGRADDVIKSSDYRIGPFEVESALVEHPAVSEAAVVGSPDPNRYQLVKAYVILNPNYQASRELALELFKHTVTILPKFKIPRMIEFVPEVPKTISGKIRRIELRQIEITKHGNSVDEGIKEYFYWDFPELSSKKK